MSLSVGTSIAYSALTTIETQLALTSANISNADTTGYTQKTATQVAEYADGVASGTAITGVTSNVDKLLLQSLVEATSDLGSADVANTYLSEAEALFGSTSDTSSSSDSTSNGGNSLANTIASLESAVSSLESSGSGVSSSDQTTVVQNLDDVAAQLRETSSGIQSLRSDADQQIATDVGQVNTMLTDIGNLNKEISTAAAAGQSTADLEDQRNTDLQTLSKYMNVSYYVNSNNQMQITTSSGQALVDGTVHTLSYTALGTVTESTTYAKGSSSGFSGIMVDGQDITSEITSGEVGGLITLRDDTLPAVQSELNSLASGLISSLNAVHNLGTSLPAPETLTGTTTTSGSDSFSGTGTIRIAVTDSSGDLVSYEDLNLANYSTVDGLVSAIDDISGVSADIDSSGNLVISSTDSSDGVSIGDSSSSVGSSDEGFSEYFGLNDLLTGSDAADISVRSDILSNAGLLGTSELDTSGTPTAGEAVISSGTTVADDLYSALTESTSFSAAGNLGQTSTSFADYAADIVADVATSSSDASTTYNSKETAQSTLSSTMSSESGVNVDQETAQLSTLQNQYSAISELISVINSMFADLLDAVKSTS